MLISRSFFIALAIAASSTAYAIEYWTADIRVNKVNITTSNKNKTYNCKATIASSHDDDARDAKAFIMLSPDLQFNAYTIANLNRNKPNDGKNANCRASRATGRLYGIGANGQSSYIECNLGHLSTQAKLEISIKGKMLRSTKFKPTCSVFVISTTPDHRPVNNFKIAR